MIVNDFILKIDTLKPSVASLMSGGGFSESFSNILQNDFLIIYKNNNRDFLNSTERLYDFLNACDVSNLSVGKINFSESLDVIDELNSFIIGGFDGGYLTRRNDGDSLVRIIYVDDIENDELIFCRNDDEFFRIILILAEYYSLTIQGKLEGSQEEVKKLFLQKLEEIFPLCNFEEFI